MLEKFRAAKQREIDRLLHAENAGVVSKPWPAPRPSFKKALLATPEIAVIAEYKRASPSRGIIREDLPLERAIAMYAGANAAAISILTEQHYFKGDFTFLEKAACAAPGMPLLRKDFIYEPVQIKATAASPASALLLIVRAIKDQGKLSEMRLLAESFGLDCVVEVFDAHDLDIARAIGAEIIQVNSRDLDKLAVDRKAQLKLIENKPPLPDEVWIAASGISRPEHLSECRAAGYRAALVGSALMECPDPGEALKALLREAGNAA